MSTGPGEADDHAVEHHGAVVGGGARERDRETCVVELAVVVHGSAVEASRWTLGIASIVASRSRLLLFAKFNRPARAS